MWFYHVLSPTSTMATYGNYGFLGVSNVRGKGLLKHTETTRLPILFGVFL